MKDDKPGIHNYTISDVSADTGRITPAKDFHIFQNQDVIHKNEKMVNHPLRSANIMIALVIGGEGKVQINLVDYHLKKNSFFIIPQNVVHRFVGRSDDIDLIALGFSSEFMSQAHFDVKHINALDFFSTQSNPYLMLHDKDAESLHVLMRVMQEKDLSDDKHLFKTEIIQHAFNIFLFEVANIFKSYRPNVNVVLSRKENILTSFLKLLSSNFKEERSVQFYADALFITPKYLTKTIKELTTKTCGEMIDEIVIIEAKILLNDLGLSVANVAAQLQFSDQFFFSKFFKKHTGINPSKYKNTI